MRGCEVSLLVRWWDVYWDMTKMFYLISSAHLPRRPIFLSLICVQHSFMLYITCRSHSDTSHLAHACYKSQVCDLRSTAIWLLSLLDMSILCYEKSLSQSIY